MKILVTSQSGPASERLLAVGERALVGAFTRVDAAMACERAAITERLDNVSDALHENQD